MVLAAVEGGAGAAGGGECEVENVGLLGLIRLLDGLDGGLTCSPAPPSSRWSIASTRIPRIPGSISMPAWMPELATPERSLAITLAAASPVSITSYFSSGSITPLKAEHSTQISDFPSGSGMVALRTS